MSSATRLATSTFGVPAGIGGLTHGFGMTVGLGLAHGRADGSVAANPKLRRS